MRSLRIALALFLAGLLAVAGAIASLLAGSTEPAGAATFTVTSDADDGSPGTLRAAITDANATPGPDVITIGPVGTITLTSPLPEITDELIITGPGAADLTLDGGGNEVFRVDTTVGAQIPLTVSGMTLTNPTSTEGGLLLNTWGQVVFEEVLLTGINSNGAISTVGGGTFTLLRSTADGNSGTLIISDHGNTPATTAPEADYENRTYVVESTITNTGPGGYGCAIATERRLYVIDSTITDTWATAVCARGLNGASFVSSTIARNGGHGVLLEGYTTASVTQNDTTFVDVAIYDNGGWGIFNGYMTDVGGPTVMWDPPGLTITDSAIFGSAADVGFIDGSKIVGSLISIPRPPSGAVGVAGEEEVEVSWTAPTSDSGSAITSYTVTATPGGATCTAPAPDTTCTVTGLTGGVAHTFQVSATNANGPSWLSPASASVTPTAAPVAPTTTAAPTTTIAPTGATGGPTNAAPTPTTTVAPVPVAGDGDDAPAGDPSRSRNAGERGSPNRSLAFTGTSSTTLALLAMALIAFGSAAVVATRGRTVG